MNKDQETLRVFSKSVAPVTVVMHVTDVPLEKCLAADCLLKMFNMYLGRYSAASMSAKCYVNGEDRADIVVSLENTGGIEFLSHVALPVMTIRYGSSRFITKRCNAVLEP